MSDPSMLCRDVLVLHRPAIVCRFRTEYAVLDEHEARIGTLTESRPTAVGARLGLAVADLPLLPVSLELQDSSGTSVLRMSKSWGRTVTHVTRGDGSPLGCVRRRLRLGRPRFDLVSEDRRVGELRGQTWRATAFTVIDMHGTELARAQKHRPPVKDQDPAADTDRYVIRIGHCAAEPLRSFAVGAILALDTVVPHHD